jgi:hypothetical protein
MITFAFFIVTLWPQPNPMYFPGYGPIPNPTPADCIIIPLDNPQPKDISIVHDPVLTA